LLNYKKDKYFKNISSYIGLFLLVIWQLDFNIFHNYRNASFLITIASILILYSSNKNIINEFLSFKILRNIGKISYPLYLVHMPVIYFTSIYLESYLVVYISIILTFLFTYFLTNFQNSNFFNLILLNVFKKNKFMHVSVIIFFIISIGTYFINKNLVFRY
jgi:peptidoglycan/LPS O-acetylase OafA/YrhL